MVLAPPNEGTRRTRVTGSVIDRSGSAKGGCHQGPPTRLGSEAGRGQWYSRRRHDAPTRRPLLPRHPRRSLRPRARAQPPAEPQAPAAPTAAPPTGPIGPQGQFDPVPQGLSVDGVKKLCDDHLAAAQAMLERIKALKGAPPAELTYEATLGALRRRRVRGRQRLASSRTCSRVAHPDEAVREAAKLCEPKADKFTTALYLDADLAAVMRAYAAKKEPLDGERKRLLADTLRDFRRNGLELSPDKQTRLRQINEQITTIGQKFESNIASSVGHVEVKPAQLDGPRRRSTSPSTRRARTG